MDSEFPGEQGICALSSKRPFLVSILLLFRYPLVLLLDFVMGVKILNRLYSDKM